MGIKVKGENIDGHGAVQHRKAAQSHVVAFIGIEGGAGESFVANVGDVSADEHLRHPGAKLEGAVSNMYHTVRNVDFCHGQIVAEGGFADHFQAVREFHIAKLKALGKGTVANDPQVLAEGDLFQPGQFKGIHADDLNAVRDGYGFQSGIPREGRLGDGGNGFGNGISRTGTAVGVLEQNRLVGIEQHAVLYAEVGIPAVHQNGFQLVVKVKYFCAQLNKTFSDDHCFQAAPGKGFLSHGSYAVRQNQIGQGGKPKGVVSDLGHAIGNVHLAKGLAVVERLYADKPQGIRQSDAGKNPVSGKGTHVDHRHRCTINMRRNGHVMSIPFVFQNGSRVMVHGYGKVVQFKDVKVGYIHGKLPFCVMVDILMQSVYGKISPPASRGGGYNFRKTENTPRINSTAYLKIGSKKYG